MCACVCHDTSSKRCTGGGYARRRTVRTRQRRGVGVIHVQCMCMCVHAWVCVSLKRRASGGYASQSSVARRALRWGRCDVIFVCARATISLFRLRALTPRNVTGHLGICDIVCHNM